MSEVSVPADIARAGLPCSGYGSCCNNAAPLTHSLFLNDARQLFQLQMLLKGDHPSAEALEPTMTVEISWVRGTNAFSPLFSAEVPCDG